jgi:hypothetical protein
MFQAMRDMCHRSKVKTYSESLLQRLQVQLSTLSTQKDRCRHRKSGLELWQARSLTKINSADLEKTSNQLKLETFRTQPTSTTLSKSVHINLFARFIFDCSHADVWL